MNTSCSVRTEIRGNYPVYTGNVRPFIEVAVDPYASRISNLRGRINAYLKQGDAATAREIATALNANRKNTSTLLTEMAKRGYVSSIIKPSCINGRESRHYFLTAKETL